ncbi:glycosyltransferase 87 family protein [Streptomyces sp. ODS28]|uniref:glycosyltransferase 87 family protein n=1 Tax=Streptomyces sp. ODS28 TaxID=3136688 RepID=UPI0031E70F32
MLTVSLAAFVALCLFQRFPMADVLVYRAEGAAVANGTDLYGFTVTEWKLPATYPPLAAVLFVPAAWLPLPVLKLAVMAGNLVLLALLVDLSLRLVGRGGTAYRLPLVLGGTGLALWLEPVFQTFVFGQINLALACLVLWDLTRPAGARGKGLAIGAAAGIKLTPFIFVVYLLLTGRVRAGLTALAGFAGTVLAGWLVLPGASVDFWTRRLYETDRVGKAWIVDNQSLQGLVARVLHDPAPGVWWVVPAAVVGVGGLWAARRVFFRRGECWGVLATALVALLVSPISWSHHWVWCVPLLAALAVSAPRWVTGVVAVVFVARSMWLIPKQGDLDLHLPWWHQPLASPYPLLGLVLLAALHHTLHHRARRT